MFKMQEYFASAFRRILQMCGSTMGDTIPLSKRTPSGLMLELPPLQGWARRPILKCNDFVGANMLNIVRTNRGNRHTANISIHVMSAPQVPIWTPEASPMSIPTFVNVKGPRLGPKASHFRDSQWSDEELRRINSFPKKHQLSEMKRLRHNRDAATKKKHVIKPFNPSTDTMIHCIKCKFSSKLGQLSRWIAEGDSNLCPAAM